MLKDIASHINTLANFCGKRDLNNLSKKELLNKYGMEKLDVIVLFGGSVLSGGDVLAEAIKNDLAHHYIIVGGYGHTSKSLFDAAEKEVPEITKGITSEAELFKRYLKIKYNLVPDYLETESTNCGNNMTNLLALIKEKNIQMKHILIIQEAAMQLRMEATLKKHVPEALLILNYAATQVSVHLEKGLLVFNQEILGFWAMDHYITLLMGEITRLHDTTEGYGPKGKQFISHVDVPETVLNSYFFLKQTFPNATRIANPAFSSRVER